MGNNIPLGSCQTVWDKIYVDPESQDILIPFQGCSAERLTCSAMRMLMMEILG